MSKYGALLLIGLLVCCISLAAFTQERPVKQNHFKVYSAKSEEIRPVFVLLKDQFTKEPSRTRLVQVRFFANPVKKTFGQTTSPIAKPNAHLTWYKFDKPETAKYKVTFANQFGDQRWTVGEAEFLLVPTQKIEPNSSMPKDFNHFKAYKVLAGEFKPVKVELTDQFDKEGKPVTVEVTKPLFFCNPTMKNKEPIVNERYHLACYAIEKAPATKVQSVNTADQFAKRKLDLGPAAMLCVPTDKREFQPTR